MSRYSKYLGQMFRVDAGENYVRVVAKYPGYANVSLKMARQFGIALLLAADVAEGRIRARKTVEK